MLQKDQLQKEDQRLSGLAQCPQAKVPTYQDLLDEALDNTFPASDPIAASAATHLHEPHTTARDARDWTLKPGACPPAGCHPDDDGQGLQRAAPTHATVVEAFTVDAVLGPVDVRSGPCTVEQTADEATLTWPDDDGRDRSVTLSVETYRQLLADGKLQREDPA